MQTKHIRIAISILLGAFALLSFYPFFIISLGIFLLLLMGLVILSIYKNEYNLLAFFYLRRGKPEKAAMFLSKIKQPEQLRKAQHAYYYFLQGLVVSQQQPIKSEKFFRKALQIGLRMEYDTAVAKLNLAGIAISKRQKMEATLLLKEVKKIDKAGMLKDQIKMMQGQMKFI